MPDTPSAVPLVTSTASQVASVAKGLASAAASGALNVASETIAKTIPNISHLTGASLSVANLANRLGSPADLMAGISSPATALADKAASALGFGGGGAAAAGASTASLAKTTFAAGADDKLASLDVYTAKSAVTPVDVTAPPPAINPLVTLKTMTSLLGAVNSLVKDYNKLSKLKITPASIVSGILSSNTLIQTAFNSLPSSLQKAIVIAQVVSATSAGLKAGLDSSVSVRSGGVTKVINNASMKEVTGMVAMTSAMSKGEYSPTVTDNAAMPMVFGNIIKIAAAMQLPGAFSALINSLDPTPANVRMKAALTTIAANSAVSHGSLSILSEVASARGKGALANSDSVLSNFGKNFVLGANESTGNSALISSKIRSTFSSIDPSWCRSAQQKNAVNTLDHMVGTSEDLFAIIKSFTKKASVPTIVKPTAVITVPADQSGSYVPPTGPGVTSTQVTNPDGSITHTIEYPPQGCPAPQPDETSLAFMGPPSPGSYSLPGTPVVSSTVSEDASSENSIVIEQTLADGQVQTVTKLSNGDQKISATTASGIITNTTLSTSCTDAETAALFAIPGDPLAGTSYLVTDPIVAAGAQSDFRDLDAQYAADNGTQALSSMNAADAISYSFPDSNIGGITSAEFDA